MFEKPSRKDEQFYRIIEELLYLISHTKPDGHGKIMSYPQ